MSSIRSRNKFCLSLDNLPSSSSSSTTHLNRWSEVVPPKTALTFAALWDPEDGMVTFSGAALLESESSDDDYAHLFPLEDGSATADENAATLATLQDVFKAFLRHSPWDSREHLNMKTGQCTPRGPWQARASSTFDGLDLYSHDVQIKSRKSVRLSCMDLLDVESSFRTSSAFGRLRLRSDLMLDSYHAESENDSDASSPHSRFSTATSNYIDVVDGAAPSAPTPEIFHVPEWNPPNECVSPAGSWPFLPRQRRVLRKRRPSDDDVSPSTATSSTPPSPPRKLKRKSSLSPSLPCSSPSASTGVLPSNNVHVNAAAAATALGPRRRRRRLSRPVRGGSISAAAAPTPPMPTLTPTSTSTSTSTSTPTTPTSPTSPPKSPRLGLRFAFLTKRKSRQTSPESQGWVCIEVTPIIRERFIPDLEED